MFDIIFFLAFYDDEDDIMIVEEKDALDVPDQIECVAEEVIIEETIANYAEIVCVSPKYIADLSPNAENICKQIDDNDESDFEPHDNDKIEPPQAESIDTDGEQNTETEPIYLSDSLSCFDSDSEIQNSEIPEERSRGNMLVLEPEDENDDVEPLNESADDVIIVPECTDTIEIDRSDTEDERFTVPYETCIESDSQPSADSTLHEGDDNRYNKSQLYETTIDADDDSSEVEKRTVRSRRDNVARKNYSCRRNYAKRKSKNNSDTSNADEMNSNKNEDDLRNESHKTLTIEYSNPEECSSDQSFGNTKMILAAMVQECNTTDGTDEENHFNLMKTKTVRTYNRKKSLTSTNKSGGNDFDAPTIQSSTDSFIIDEQQESNSQTEDPKSSYHEVHVSDEPKPESTSMPRKRGRPRKNAMNNLVMHHKSTTESTLTDEKESNSSSGNQSPSNTPEVQNFISTTELNSQCENAPEIQTSIKITDEIAEEIVPIQVEEHSIINEDSIIVEDDVHVDRVSAENEMEVKTAKSIITREDSDVTHNSLHVDHIISIEDDCFKHEPTQGKYMTVNIFHVEFVEQKNEIIMKELI